MSRRWAPTALPLVVCLACAWVSACGNLGGGPTRPTPSPAATTTIVETLRDEGLTTMARVVCTAGLESRLSATGPYTLVVPDDDAFGALPAGTMADLLRVRSRARALVLDQLIAGKVPPEALSDGLQTLTMYAPSGLAEAGHRLTWAVRDGAVSVDGARVTAAIAGANGIVYVVDRLLPPAPQVWARPSRARPGERVSVVCRWTRADGTPVADARCIFGWHFGDWMPHDVTWTNASGVARCSRVVPGQPGAHRVLVTVTTRGDAPTRTVVAAFTVR